MSIYGTQAAELKDDILVKDFLQGNAKSFELLVLKHQDSVFNIVYRIVGDSEEALDISQEAFLRAFENIRSYDSKYPFKSWLLRISINRAIDHLRRSQKCRSKLGQEVPLYESARYSNVEPLCASESSFQTEPENPEAKVLIKEELEALKNALTTLPENYKAVLILYHIEGMNYREISKTLSVSKNTAKTWARRGRKALAQALERTQKEANTR